MSYDSTLFENVADEFPSLFEHSFGHPFSGIMPAGYHRFISVHHSGELVGWMIVNPNYTDKTGYISWGAMLPLFRGNRDALKHFSRGIMMLRNEGLEWLHLITRRENTAMQVLALKLGFLVNGTVAGKDGALEIMMHKHLGEEA